MNNWSHGYNVSMGYSFGFYREMAPDWLDFCVWIGGFEPPQRTGRPFRYLELSCGQGFRQDMQDFAINQGFRRDIFCRGELKPLRGGFPADDARFVLVTQPEAGTELQVPTSYDRLSLPYRDVAPIVQALGNGPRSGEELASVAGLVDKEFRRLIILLIQAGVVAVMADQPGNPDAANRLNAAIARAACDRGPYEQLAAAQIGSAIGTSQIELSSSTPGWRFPTGQTPKLSVTEH